MFGELFHEYMIQKLKMEKQELNLKIRKLDRWLDNCNLSETELSTRGILYLGIAIEQLGAMKKYAQCLDEKIKLLEE